MSNTGSRRDLMWLRVFIPLEGLALHVTLFQSWQLSKRLFVCVFKSCHLFGKHFLPLKGQIPLKTQSQQCLTLTYLLCSMLSDFSSLSGAVRREDFKITNKLTYPPLCSMAQRKICFATQTILVKWINQLFVLVFSFDLLTIYFFLFPLIVQLYS